MNGVDGWMGGPVGSIGESQSARAAKINSSPCLVRYKMISFYLPPGDSIICGPLLSSLRRQTRDENYQAIIDISS